jgi:S1-C subfamily serine protease
VIGTFSMPNRFPRQPVRCWQPLSALALAVALLSGLQLPLPAIAEESGKTAQPIVVSAEDMPSAQTVEQIAEQARKSVVVITVAGRDGKQQGLGTGFVIRENGLIATNLHVIGEARPISVQFADGKKYDVQSVHASDRKLDLALVKIDAEKLPVLKLGDPGTLKDGR